MILIPLLLSFAVTVLATPICLILLKKYKIMDDPASHKHPGIIHAKPVPRGGGVPFFLGILIPALLLLPLTKITIALYIAGTIAVIIGVLDDKADVSPYLRFLANIIVAGIVVGSGVGIPFVTSPFGGILHLDAIKLQFDVFGRHSIILFSDLVALVWIVWVMNMLNWSKGVDGQMPGIVAISAFVIGLLSLRFSTADFHTLLSAELAFMIAGSALGFLLFNFYPAKIFPGYSATAVYLMLSVISILSGAKLATVILVMGVPMVDGIFTVARRILSGKSPFWHDRRHLHHLLLKLGLTQRQIALCYWLFSAILGAISLSLSSQGKLFALIVLLTLVGGALVFLHLGIEQYEDETAV